MEPTKLLLLFTLFSAIVTVTLSSPESNSHQRLTLHPLSLQISPNSQLLSTLTPLDTQNSSLSLQLHHVESLTSSVNKTLSPEALFSLRLQRDATRVKLLTTLAQHHHRNVTTHSPRGFSSSIISGLTQGSGEYFTRIGIGTPPRYAYMVLDTGSDVVWVQCAPCRSCYSQADPVFNPVRSRSFFNVPCGSPLCRKLDSPGCNRATKKCLYQVSYGDGSFTFGEFSTETLTFRGVRMPRVALGCGHDNEGLFVGAAGLLGLGRGRLSFPAQAGRRFNRKFSYCLVDRSELAKPSLLMFGDSAVSRTARFTPMLMNRKLNTFYYVELVGVSVGGTRVRGITPGLFKLDPAGNGGVIIDSGTSVTRLTRSAYVALRNAFRAGSRGLKRAPEFSLFDTCFDLAGKTTVRVPTVVLHFRGADMALPASNYLIPVDRRGTFCFAFAGTMSGLSIIGNIQQQGFRVVFDLAGSRVGFSPRGC